MTDREKIEALERRVQYLEEKLTETLDLVESTVDALGELTKAILK